MASVIPHLVLVSLLTLVFCVGLNAASELPQTHLDCSLSGDIIFLSLRAEVEDSDHGAWPHPSYIPPAVLVGAGVPYCPEPLCGITWCYETSCLFPLQKEPKTACLGFLR